MVRFIRGAEIELNELPESNLTDFGDRVICFMRRQFPGQFDRAIQGTPGLNFNAPLVAQWFWARVCSRREARNQDQETSYFYGGQCPVEYLAVGELNRTGGGSPSGTPLVSQFGPLSVFRWRRVVDEPNGRFNWIMDIAGPDNVIRSFGMGSEPFATADRVLPRLRLRRSDNLPDNCGNLIPAPPAPPPLYQPTYEFEQEINGQVINVEVRFPELDWRDPDNPIFEPVIEFNDYRIRVGIDGWDIDFPETQGARELPPSDNIEFNDAVTNINNNVNTSVDAAVNTVVDTVITTSSSVRDLVNLNTQNRINIAVGQLTNLINQRFTTVNETLADILQELNDCCGSDATYVSEVIVTETEGGTYSLPADTVVAVIFAAEPLTPNTPFQEGSGDAPRVYHWGSYSVNYASNCNGDRVPLQFARQSTPVFARATGVTIWPTYENKATLVAIYKESES